MQPPNRFSNPCTNTDSPAWFSHQATPLNIIPSLLATNCTQWQEQLGINLHVQKITLTNSKYRKLARPLRNSKVVRSFPYLTVFFKYSDEFLVLSIQLPKVSHIPVMLSVLETQMGGVR